MVSDSRDCDTFIKGGCKKHPRYAIASARSVIGPARGFGVGQTISAYVMQIQDVKERLLKWQCGG
jgi:hypothetical protein